MNLYHLRYFMTLARLEHYTRAAEELCITQPSLSHAIASLEGQLGVSLFEKVGRNIQLTKYGRAFLHDVEMAVGILDAGVNSLKMAATGEEVVEIGFVKILGVNVVPGLVRDFLDRQRDRRIRFKFSTGSGLSQDLLDDLKEKRYDMVFCSRLDHEPSIEFIPVASQELVVIVPERHPLADKESLRLEETLPYPQIIFDRKSGLRHIVDGIFSRINAYPTVALEVEEDQVAAGLVAHGFGIAVAPRMEILDHMAVRVIPLVSPQWERKFYAAVLRDAYRAPSVEEFYRFVNEQADR